MRFSNKKGNYEVNFDRIVDDIEASLEPNTKADYLNYLIEGDIESAYEILLLNSYSGWRFGVEKEILSIMSERSEQLIEKDDTQLDDDIYGFTEPQQIKEIPQEGYSFKRRLGKKVLTYKEDKREFIISEGSEYSKGSIISIVKRYSNIGYNNLSEYQKANLKDINTRVKAIRREDEDFLSRFKILEK